MGRHGAASAPTRRHGLHSHGPASRHVQQRTGNPVFLGDSQPRADGRSLHDRRIWRGALEGLRPAVAYPGYTPCKSPG